MPRTLHRYALGQTIEDTLAPVLGAALARGALRAHLERLGIHGDELDASQVDAVLGALEKALRVFVGSPKAATLLAEVRAAIGGTGTA